jgi:hypothetical protein
MLDLFFYIAENTSDKQEPIALSVLKKISSYNELEFQFIVSNIGIEESEKNKEKYFEFKRYPANIIKQVKQLIYE